MDPLVIELGDDTPKVVLDKTKGIFEISGRSLPEDTVQFFKPILEWLRAYKNDPNPPLNLYLNLIIPIPPRQSYSLTCCKCCKILRMQK